MACCGQKRTALKRQQDNSQNAVNRTHFIEKQDIEFMFTGNSNLRLIGAITFRKYSFRCKGATQLIDARDVASVMAEPHLIRSHT